MGWLKEPRMYIMGFEVRRSDTPQIGRDFQEQLFEMIVEKKTKKEILEFIQDFKKKVKTASASEIGIPVGISKKISSYTNLPIHIRAAKNANKYHNAQFKTGDKIKYVYIVKGIGKCNDNVIAFKDKLWKGYKIDYPKMIERLVEKKVINILEALNLTSNKQSQSLMEFM